MRSAPYRWGIDIDGVLADFNTSFIALVRAQTGIQLPSPSATYPDLWAYHRAAGVTNAQDSALWEWIKLNPGFWEQLQPLPHAVETLATLRDMSSNLGANVYFITSRPGSGAKSATEYWLRNWGFHLGPTVCIAHAKGPLVESLELDVFIDDRPENCLDAKVAREACRVFIVDAPYNRLTDNHLLNPMDYGRRVRSALEAIHLVQEGAQVERIAA